MINGKTILITGGTGSLGKALTKTIFEKWIAEKLKIISKLWRFMSVVYIALGIWY